VVERIELQGSGVALGTAFPGLAGQVFNLRDFEQGLDQVNRLRSNAATLDILPGRAPGASVVQISNQPARRLSGGASVDNTGSVATGRDQLAVNLGLDDPLRLNDYLNLSLRANTDYQEGSRMSRALALFYSVPYGPWLFSFSASDFSYASQVPGQVSTFTTTGTSATRALKAERTVYRDQFVKASLSAGVTTRDNRNFLNDQLLLTSTRKLTVLDLGANVSVNAWGGLWSLYATQSRGLKAFGAESDEPGRSPLLPQAQFTKLTYGASLSRPFQLAGTNLAWQSSLNGQHARDVLYGTEQFFVGGPFSVRGFRRISLAGDSGAWWRNELATTIPLGAVGPDGRPSQLRPFVAYDVGTVREKNGLPGGTLAGATVGVTWNAAPVSLTWSFSRPVRAPSAFDGIRDRYLYVRFAVDI
jgi:hemolysin activation/secretion protein